MSKVSVKEERPLAAGAQDATERFRFLYEAASVLSSSLDVDAIAGSLSRLAVPTLGDLCIVDLVEDGQIRRAAAAHSDPSKQDLASRLLAYSPDLRDHGHPVVHAIEAGGTLPEVRSELADDALRGFAPEPEQLAVLRELGVRAALIVPLAAQDKPLGAITLMIEGRRSFGSRDLTDAEQVGRRAECAFRNARLLEESRAAVRLREEILSVVSHDLRNPLSRVYLATDQLQRAVPAEQARHVEIIRRSAQHMNRLIQDLVEITKLEQGRLALDRRRNEIDVLVRDAIDLVAQKVEQKSIDLGESVDHGLPPVTVDRVRIVQVLTNLLDNAFKHTAAGGKIAISARAVQGGVAIAVCDTGTGIAPEMLPHVFDRFKHAKKWSRDGAGLGLAIARGIVEAHGGTIRVESKVGVGSTFEIFLPVAVR
ncbi:MAG: GAF domain-containing sensor histidine kinase [Deltaproteobacteria bacterium]|nr:GAF domain-containing sensor histidine kinase [Deltaproteobacteria bacterium]